MQVGPKWTYKLRLEMQTTGGPKSQLVLGKGVFSTEEAAREAGAEHLKSELEKRSG